MTLHQPLPHPGGNSPRRKPPGQERSTGDKEANRSINTLRAAVERAIAHLKDWKILATRYRGPLTHFPLVAKTVTGVCQSNGVSRVVGVTAGLRRVGRRR
ncbi:transposase family protein [Streptomyces lavendulae]|uniref:transposase family protein n=1 Tax=Streptomyces lavendulae TaxID=1914 RepID=UPI0033DDDA1E